MADDQDGGYPGPPPVWQPMHMANDIDQGGFCNRLFMHDGYGDTCGLPVNHPIHILSIAQMGAAQFRQTPQITDRSKDQLLDWVPEGARSHHYRSSCRSRSKDTSAALTEVRTVLSRARTALKRWTYPDGGPYTETYSAFDPRLDPDGPEMVRALESVVAQLERWGRK